MFILVTNINNKIEYLHHVNGNLTKDRNQAINFSNTYEANQVINSLTKQTDPKLANLGFILWIENKYYKEDL